MFSNQNHYANSHSVLFLTVTKEKTFGVYFLFCFFADLTQQVQQFQQQ